MDSKQQNEKDINDLQKPDQDYSLWSRRNRVAKSGLVLTLGLFILLDEPNAGDTSFWARLSVRQRGLIRTLIGALFVLGLGTVTTLFDLKPPSSSNHFDPMIAVFAVFGFGGTATFLWGLATTVFGKRWEDLKGSAQVFFMVAGSVVGLVGMVGSSVFIFDLKYDRAKNREKQALEASVPTEISLAWKLIQEKEAEFLKKNGHYGSITEIGVGDQVCYVFEGDPLKLEIGFRPSPGCKPDSHFETTILGYASTRPPLQYSIMSTAVYASVSGGEIQRCSSFHDLWSLNPFLDNGWLSHSVSDYDTRTDVQDVSSFQKSCQLAVRAVRL